MTDARYEELKDLVKTKVLVQRARDDKIKFTKQDDRRLKLEVARQSQGYGGPEGLKRALAKIGVPYSYFVSRQKANILISKLLVKNISRDIYITPREVRQHYKRNLEKYRRKGDEFRRTEDKWEVVSSGWVVEKRDEMKEVGGTE